MDDIFKQKLAGYQQRPDEEVWANIAMELSGQKGLVRRKRMLWLSAAASLLLLIGLSGWWVFESTQPATDVLAVNKLLTAAQDDQNGLLQSMSAAAKQNQKIDVVAPQTPIKTISSEKLVTEIRRNETHLPELASVNPPSVPAQPARRTFLAIAQPSHLPAEQVKEKRPLFHKSRLRLSGYLAPTYSYRFLSSNSGTVNQQVRFYNGVEEGLASYAGGMHLSYQLTARLTVKSGVSYHRLGQQLNYMNAYVNKVYADAGLVPNNEYQLLSSSGPIAVNTGYFIEDNVNVRVDYASRNKFNLNSNADAFMQIDDRVEQVYHYVAFPLHLQYRLFGKPHKGHFEVVAGVNLSWMLGNSLTLKHDGERMKMAEASQLSRFGLQGVVGMAYAIPIRSGLEFRLQPTFTSFVKPINPGFETQSRPYEFALQTGFALSF